MTRDVAELLLPDSVEHLSLSFWRDDFAVPPPRRVRRNEGIGGGRLGRAAVLGGISCSEARRTSRCTYWGLNSGPLGLNSGTGLSVFFFFTGSALEPSPAAALLN